MRRPSTPAVQADLAEAERLLAHAKSTGRLDDELLDDIDAFLVRRKAKETPEGT